jgi:hypothetical protein
VAALAALLVPGAPSLVFAGVPLSPVGIAGVALVVYAALALPRIGTRPAALLTLVCVVVIGVKLASAAAAPPLGMQASYWPAATPPNGAAPERSTDFFVSPTGPTRVDTRLALRAKTSRCTSSTTRRASASALDVQPARGSCVFRPLGGLPAGPSPAATPGACGG